MASYLQALIRQVLDEYDEPAPQLIANRVARRLPANKLRAALEECLKHEVREMVRRERTIGVRPNGTAGPSPRWKEAGETIFRHRYYVGTDWKFLGECTPEDIQAIILECYRRADEQIASGRRFEALRDEMEREGAKQVKLLDAERVQEVLGAVAVYD